MPTVPATATLPGAEAFFGAPPGLAEAESQAYAAQTGIHAVAFEPTSGYFAWGACQTSEKPIETAPVCRAAGGGRGLDPGSQSHGEASCDLGAGQGPGASTPVPPGPPAPGHMPQSRAMTAFGKVVINGKPSPAHMTILEDDEDLEATAGGPVKEGPSDNT